MQTRAAAQAGSSAPAEAPRRLPISESLKLELRRLLAEALIADVRAEQEGDGERDAR